MSVLVDLFAAHVEWLGCRATLTGGERRKFERWVLRAHPEIAAHFRNEPARFRAACQEVRRGMVLPKQRGIGMATLQRHACELRDHYRALSSDSRGTFVEFLERVLRECPTEQALKRLLAKP